MSIEGKHFFVPGEIAQYLQVPRHHVYRLIREGRLPAIRIGARCIRVTREALDEFVNVSAHPPSRPRTDP